MDFELSFNLADDELGVSMDWMPIWIASSRPTTRTSYSTSLLVLGLDRAREYHMISPSDETKMRPMLALICGTVNPAIVRAEDAPSKYSFQQGFLFSIDITASSSKSQMRGESFGSGCATRKSARACPFIALWGMKAMPNSRRIMVYLANLPINIALVIRNLRGSSLEMRMT